MFSSRDALWDRQILQVVQSTLGSFCEDVALYIIIIIYDHLGGHKAGTLEGMFFSPNQVCWYSGHRLSVLCDVTPSMLSV